MSFVKGPSECSLKFMNYHLSCCGLFKHLHSDGTLNNLRKITIIQTIVFMRWSRPDLSYISFLVAVVVAITILRKVRLFVMYAHAKMLDSSIIGAIIKCKWKNSVKNRTFCVFHRQSTTFMWYHAKNGNFFLATLHAKRQTGTQNFAISISLLLLACVFVLFFFS